MSFAVGGPVPAVLLHLRVVPASGGALVERAQEVGVTEHPIDLLVVR